MDRADYLAELHGVLEKAESSALLAFYGEPVDVQVHGETGDYVINVVNQTCTCPDYLTMRAAFQKGHLRRICKHLADALKRDAEAGTFEQITFSRIRFGLSSSDRFRFTGLLDGRKVLIFKHAERDWCDVIAPYYKTGKYDLFGFSVLQERWSYHTRPAGEPQIKEVLLQWLRAIELLNEA